MTSDQAYAWIWLPGTGLSKNEARDIIDGQIDTVRTRWEDAAEHARLGRERAELLMGRQVLNPKALDGYGA